jgi:hypothetical protein
MTKSGPEPAQSFAQYLASLSPEELASINEEQRTQAAEEHKHGFQGGAMQFLR